jgi:hypothetical protein
MWKPRTAQKQQETAEAETNQQMMEGSAQTKPQKKSHNTKLEMDLDGLMRYWNSENKHTHSC